MTRVELLEKALEIALELLEINKEKREEMLEQAREIMKDTARRAIKEHEAKVK